MPKTSPRESVEDLRNSPGLWFTVLEDALRRGDHKREAEARNELARLGVAVFVDERRLSVREART